MTARSNLAQGRESYDAELSTGLVEFFNRNITPYPTESSGPKFDLIPVKKQKDQMVNVARMYAQQEYNRIMDLVQVLQTQAADIKRRLEITDAIHAAQYNFQVYHGQVYWLAYDGYKQCTILTHNGPNDWGAGAPIHYEYICKVKWLGDHTWVELDKDDNYN
jgi:hypothetical protein